MQRCLYFILLKVLLVRAAATMAQTVDSTVYTTAADGHIAKMNDYLSLKLSLSDNVEGFVTKTSTVKYDLRPNDKTVAKLSFNYRFISFVVSTTPKFIPGNNDTELKGKSKYTNYALSFTFNHWVQSLAYTRLKGYYLENTRDFRPGWREGADPYVQFPDLVYHSFQGQTAYKFNKKFSFNALSVQTERQLKSAGTLMPFAGYRYYIVDDRHHLTAQGQAQKSNNIEAMLSLAYFYTLVIDQRFYLSAGVAPGAGYIFTRLHTRTVTESYTSRYSNPVYRLEGNIALGYNAPRFFAGAQLNAASVFYSRKKFTNVIENERASYQLLIGYRFVAPKFLKSLLDKAEQKGNELLHTL